MFELDTAEWAHKVLLSDKNLLALIENPKPFIIPVFSWLAPPSMVSNKHFVLKDFSFYEVARLADFETHQRRTLRQASTVGHSSSCFIIYPPTQKKKKSIACPV